MRLVNEQDKLREMYREWAEEMYEDVMRVPVEGRDGFFFLILNQLKGDIITLREFCLGNIELSETDIEALIFAIEEDGGTLTRLQQEYEQDNLKPDLTLLKE